MKSVKSVVSIVLSGTKFRQFSLFVSVAWLVLAAVQAETIAWSNNPQALNLTSLGAPMGGSFNFELGVFKGSFVPSAANTAQWVANWVPAQRVSYNASNQHFDGQYTVVSNITPFTLGKAAYIWGFQGGVAASEWILFRNPAWTWPAPNPTDPFGLDWNAANATAVLGAIHATGSPCLMQSVAVADSASPVSTWQQWQAVELAGAALSGPNDDPDDDGTTNLLEYVFGLPPLQAGAAPVMPVTIVTVAGQRFLQISIPRRSDHPATLTVQVGSDLINWQSAAAATVVVTDVPAGLVLRDLTPLGAGTAQRFMRVKVEVATP